MAKSGSIVIGQGTQSIEKNTSVITVKGTITTSGESYRGSHRGGTITVTQDGTVIYSGTFTSGAPANSTTVLFNETITVTHKTDGSSGTISASYNYDSGWCTASKSATLSTIPRRSTPTLNDSLFTITKENVNFMRIYTNRKVSSFTHHIYYSVNGGSEVGITSGVEEYYDWYFPNSLANKMPNNEKVKGYIRLYTFNGTTNIGSNTVSFEMQVSDEFQPTATFSLLDPEEHFDKYGKYVQGKSKLQVIISAEGDYGSTIKSYKTIFDGKTYTESEFTTDFIVGKDNLDLSIVVTDTRDRTFVIDEIIEVYEYNPPKILEIKAKRCQEHNANELGEDYLGVIFSSEVTSLGEQNTVVYELDYKKIKESVYTTKLVEDYANLYAVNGYAIFAADNDAYNIILRITDDFGSVEKKINGPSISVLVSKLKYNLGIAFGKLAELEGVFDIGFKTRFFGGILYKVLETESKADEILTPNRYLVKAKNTYTGFPENEVQAVLDVVGDDEIIKQTFSVIDKVNPRSYERVYTFAEESWSDWLCLCGDFIVEQGTIEDWNYRKWNSGIAECWRINTYGSIDITSPWGSIYESGTMAPVWFPINFFVEAPVCHALPHYGSNMYFVECGQITKEHTGTLWICRPTSMTVTNVALSFFAIGKWK